LITNKSAKKTSFGSRNSAAALAAALFLLYGCADTQTKPSAPQASSTASTSAEIPNGPASSTPSPVEIAAIVASPDRRPADRTNDARHKPEQMLSFVGINRGMTALDLSAGGGYTTELLARTIGPTGRVYGQVAPRPDGAPPSFATLTERAKGLTAGRIIPVLQKFENPVPDAVAKNGLDLATMMFNYHDLGHLGVDRAQMNKAVFAALKPGSMYVIADHAGRPGTGISESGTLHRVEENFVVKEVESAGFKLVERADFLRNPADPRDKNVPDNGQPKDEFVLKFVRP
jgi:predicted methyltransferase